mgnify:CR=1 FL=1
MTYRHHPAIRVCAHHINHPYLYISAIYSQINNFLFVWVNTFKYINTILHYVYKHSVGLAMSKHTEVYEALPARLQDASR